MKLKKGNGDKKESKLFPKEVKFGTSLKDVRAGLIKNAETPNYKPRRFKEGSREHKRLVATMNMKPTYTFEGKTYKTLYVPSISSNMKLKNYSIQAAGDFYNKTPVKDAKTMTWEQLYDRDFKDGAKFEKKVKSDKMKRMSESLKKETARLRTQDNPLKNK